MIKLYVNKSTFWESTIMMLFFHIFLYLPAFANAPAPSNYAWFMFDTAPDGVQLVHCESKKCEKP